MRGCHDAGPCGAVELQRVEEVRFEAKYINTQPPKLLVSRTCDIEIQNNVLECAIRRDQVAY